MMDMGLFVFTFDVVVNESFFFILCQKARFGCCLWHSASKVKVTGHLKALALDLDDSNKAYSRF